MRATGSPEILLIHGQSGMGKTALLERFLSGVKAEGGALVLTGRCHERESIPYKAVDSLIDALIAHLRSLPVPELTALLPDDIALIARLFPTFAEISAGGTSNLGKHMDDPVEMRRQAFAALRTLFHRLSQVKPLVLAIDDLHWGDTDSGTLLDVVTAVPGAPRLLLIGCYRSEAVISPTVAVLSRRAQGPGATVAQQRVLLGPLSAAEATELAEGLLAGSSIHNHAVALAEESGGVPLFIRKLADHFLSKHPLPGDAAPTLTTAMVASIAALPREAQTLLEMVAVAGRPLARAFVFGAAEVSAGKQEHLTVLQNRHLVRTTGPDDDDEIEAYHARVRETVLEQLPEPTRRAHHRQLALVLERAASIDAPALSMHFEMGGELDRAVHYADQAGDQAAGALAFDLAVQQYQHALRLHAGSEQAALALRRKLAEALAKAGRGAQAAPEYLTVAVTASGIEKHELQCRAAIQFLASGRFDDGIEIFRSVLRTLGLKLARTPRQAFWRLIGARLLLQFRRYGCRLRPAGALSHADEHWLETCRVGWNAICHFDNIRAAELSTRHLLGALRLGDPHHVALALGGEATVLCAEPAQRLQGERLIRRAEQLADATGDLYARTFARLARAFLNLTRGRWRASLELAEEAAATLRNHFPGNFHEVSALKVYIYNSLFYLGEWGDLARQVAAELPEAADRGNLYDGTFLRIGYGNAAWLAADDPARALRELQEAISKWSVQGFHLVHFWALLAEVHIHLYEGNAQTAWETLQKRWPALETSYTMRVQLVRVQMRDLRGRCALAQSTGGDRALLRQAERDARDLRQQRMPWSSALAQLLTAGIQVRYGRNDQARGALAHAAEQLDRADMALHAAVARRRHGQLLGNEPLVSAADTRIRELGISAPERIAAMLAPF